MAGCAAPLPPEPRSSDPAAFNARLELDASRRLWRCVPGAVLSSSGSGATYTLSASLAALGTYAIIFSSSAAAPHPNLADVYSPPPPPPTTGGGSSGAAVPSPPGFPTPVVPAAAAPSALGPFVAGFSFLMLLAAQHGQNALVSSSSDPQRPAAAPEANPLAQGLHSGPERTPTAAWMPKRGCDDAPVCCPASLMSPLLARQVAAVISSAYLFCAGSPVQLRRVEPDNPDSVGSNPKAHSKAHSHGQKPPLAGPQPGSCASLWGELDGSGPLGAQPRTRTCEPQPPPTSPISSHLDHTGAPAHARNAWVRG